MVIEYTTNHKYIYLTNPWAYSTYHKKECNGDDIEPSYFISFQMQTSKAKIQQDNSQVMHKNRYLEQLQFNRIIE